MVSRYGLVFAMAAAIVFACASAVLAQSNDSESTRPNSQRDAEPRDLDPQRAAEEEEGSTESASEDISSLSVGDTVPDRYIVVLKDDAQPEGEVSSAREEPAQIASEMSQEHSLDVRRTYHAALKGFSARIPEGELDRVRSDERVEFVDEVTVVEASRKKKKKKKRRPAPPAPNTQVVPTGIQRTSAVNSPTAAINSIDGRVDADIAVLDTGIAPHGDLNRPGGADCSQGDQGNFSDGHGHGTHVAGSAAALDNTFGVVGVAPGARVWAIKVLSDAGTGSTDDVVCGIDVVAANSGLFEVANMSLGGSGADDGNCGFSNNDAKHKAICTAVNTEGVPIVVAAGNEAVDLQTRSPAAYDEVITVTNLADYDGKPGADGPLASTCDAGPDDDDDYRTNSNFATLTLDKAHTISAPGTCILSTWFDGTYNTISGTSMASPHVAGAAAMIKAKNPGAAPDLVKSTLLNTANSEPYDDAIPTSTHSRWQWRSGFGYAKLHDERMMLANNF